MITIVGADWCPACQRAKKIVKERGLEYNYVHIPPGQPGWDMVEALTGKRSIPQIFYHFGGLKEFNNAVESTMNVSEIN